MNVLDKLVHIEAAVSELSMRLHRIGAPSDGFEQFEQVTLLAQVVEADYKLIKTIVTSVDFIHDECANVLKVATKS